MACNFWLLKRSTWTGIICLKQRNNQVSFCVWFMGFSASLLLGLYSLESGCGVPINLQIFRRKNKNEHITFEQLWRTILFVLYRPSLQFSFYTFITACLAKFQFENLPQIIAPLLTDSKPRGVSGVRSNTDFAGRKLLHFSKIISVHSRIIFTANCVLSITLNTCQFL